MRHSTVPASNTEHKAKVAEKEYPVNVWFKFQEASEEWQAGFLDSAHGVDMQLDTDAYVSGYLEGMRY